MLSHLLFTLWSLDGYGQRRSNLVQKAIPKCIPFDSVTTALACH